MSRILVDHLKLETEPHSQPYTLNWIKKGLSIKVKDLCHISISVDKFYPDSVVYDVVDMKNILVF